MKEDALNQSQITELINVAFSKIENSESIDTKIAVEKSNTLNWILALTTLFVGIVLQNLKNIDIIILKSILLNTEIILFALTTFSLIVFKYFFNNYEKCKKSLLSLFYSHKLELIFDIQKKVSPHLKNEELFIPNIINKFRNGEFIPVYDSLRLNEIKSLDNKIRKNCKWLKLFYNSAIILFFLNFILIVFLMTKINGG